MDASVERQTEINEWEYNSKRDTLFISQLLFIGITIIIVMYWTSSTGIISDMLVSYITIIIFALLGIIWYTRYVYSRVTRDKQHWNKIHFAEDGKKSSTLSSTVLSSVATATNEKCRGENRPRGSQQVGRGGSNTNYNMFDGDGSNIDYSMFDGERYGFYTEQTHPGSAAAYNRDGSVYGDRNRDGRLGNWDTTDGSFDEYPEDVSSVNLEQGRNYRTMNVDDGIDVADTGAEAPVSMDDRLSYCLNNPGTYEPRSNIPCKEFWCTENPSLSWTDPGASGSDTDIPCRVLFPNL